jgi:DNA-binding protein Alba
MEIEVLVGKKPVRNYLAYIVAQLPSGKKADVLIKSRGASNSKSIDLYELLKSEVDKELKTVSIATETVPCTREYKGKKYDGKMTELAIKLSVTAKAA